MKNIVRLVFITLLLSSCATVFKGNKQVMQFTTEPSGADVSVDGNLIGKTPLTTMLKKNTYSLVTFTKPGYVSVTKPLAKQYDAVALVSIFWDFSTTDMISGAAFEYEPNMFHINLEKQTPDSGTQPK